MLLKDRLKEFFLNVPDSEIEKDGYLTLIELFHQYEDRVVAKECCELDKDDFDLCSLLASSENINNEDCLHKLLESAKNENHFMQIAIRLATLDSDEGFYILELFAQNIHPTQKYISLEELYANLLEIENKNERIQEMIENIETGKYGCSHFIKFSFYQEIRNLSH